MPDANQEETSWEINLRVPYEQIMACMKEKEKSKKLQMFISRTVKLVEKKIVKFEDFENLDDLLRFVERLLIVLNECHLLLESELPGFDEKLLPILEKYASLLVYQSSQAQSQVECMRKLVKFLSSLPVHKDLKVSGQARVKTIVSLLLTAAQTDPSQCSKQSEKKSKKAKDAQTQDEKNQISIIINQPEASPVNTSKLIQNQLESTTESSIERAPSLDQVKTVSDIAGCCQELRKDTNTIKRSLSPTVESTSLIEELEETSKETIFRASKESCEIKHDETTVKKECTVPAVTESEIDMTIPTEKAKPSLQHTDLQELQKMLRNRFPVPWNITTTEKFLLRRLLRLLRSDKPRKSFVWKISLRKSDASNLEESTSTITESELQSHRDTSISSTTSEESKNSCDNIDSFKSATSEAKPVNTSTSEQEDSFFSCKTLQDDSFNSEPSNKKEDPFEKLKQLTVKKPDESELTLSDVELMEEMEITLRRLEKESEGESSDKNSDLPDDPLPCTSDLLEKLPSGNWTDEPNKLDRTKKSLNVTDKSSPTPSAADRRRSPRLAGLPALPLVFTRQPLPGKRKCSSPPSTSTTITRRRSTSDEKSGLHQLESIEEASPVEPTPKRTRYSGSETPDVNRTPNLPKKAVRRRIVSLDADPYRFVASDEEELDEQLVIEEPKPQTESLSKEKLLPKADSSIPAVVELSPCSEEDVETVFPEIKFEKKTKGALQKKSPDLLPITPESETSSYRAGSSLNLNATCDDKSNDSVQEIGLTKTEKTNGLETRPATFKKFTWQEIRKLLPTCWANILEQHVKTHHADEFLLCREPDGTSSNIPMVYCCSAPES